MVDRRAGADQPNQRTSNLSRFITCPRQRRTRTKLACAPAGYDPPATRVGPEDQVHGCRSHFAQEFRHPCPGRSRRLAWAPGDKFVEQVHDSHVSWSVTLRLIIRRGRRPPTSTVILRGVLSVRWLCLVEQHVLAVATGCPFPSSFSSSSLLGSGHRQRFHVGLFLRRIRAAR